MVKRYVRLNVSKDVWQMVNRERMDPDWSIDTTLKYVFEELFTLRMNVIKRAEQELIDERLDSIGKNK
jgi:hypothetical protein